MFPATSFAEPKLSELVPTLTGEFYASLKPGNKSTKPKHFYTFHQRQTAHASECFRNPANADTNTNTNAAKSANVINTPALTSSPTVRFNDLFNN
ncbi:hypothetical protein N7501_004278 [Penicillium viridicatum]|nr:hypothetical protein N7501_004278 [Penicillium viridicatum]